MAELTDALREELLKVIAAQVKSSPPTIIFAMCIVAYMISRHTDGYHWVWMIWLVLVFFAQGLRIVRWPKLPEETHRPASERTREAAYINYFTQGVNSLSLLAFPLLTPFEASVQTLMFIGMGVGSIITAVGWRPFAIAHLGISILPFSALWIWSGLLGPSGTTGFLLGLVALGYCASMWAISARVFRMNVEFFSNRGALAVALDEARAAGDAKTRFLAAASHDLRQPLHSLSLFSAALSRRELDDRTREISDSIESSLQAVSTELDALLDISKLDAGVVPVSIQRVSLRTLITRLIDELRPRADEAGTALELHCAVNALCSTDPALLERILRNLIINAIVHNPACTISVSVTRYADDWRVEVSDTGSGIPTDLQAHIFEEFYQVHNPERDRNKGLGLGLAIVQRLVNLLGLRMQFDSTPGRGTSFRLIIPIAAGIDDSATASGSDAITPNCKHILVLDDDAEVRKGMAMLLGTEDCSVALAATIDAAVASAKRNRPDIAIVDYRLREGDSGLDAIEALRQVHPGLPAILVSGETSPERLKGADSFGVPLLTKPVPTDTLLRSIGAEISASRAGVDAQYGQS